MMGIVKRPVAAETADAFFEAMRCTRVNAQSKSGRKSITACCQSLAWIEPHRYIALSESNTSDDRSEAALWCFFMYFLLRGQSGLSCR